MKHLGFLGSIFIATAAIGTMVRADNALVSDFGAATASEWAYFEDGVMGGVSSGQSEIRTDGSERCRHAQFIHPSTKMGQKRAIENHQ